VENQLTRRTVGGERQTTKVLRMAVELSNLGYFGIETRFDTHDHICRLLVDRIPVHHFKDLSVVLIIVGQHLKNPWMISQKACDNGLSVCVSLLTGLPPDIKPKNLRQPYQRVRRVCCSELFSCLCLRLPMLLVIVYDLHQHHNPHESNHQSYIDLIHCALGEW
jgi:hypothetical protein